MKGVGGMDTLWIIVFLIIYVVSLAVVFFLARRKTVSTLEITDVNNLLESVLKVSFQNGSVSGAAQSIINVLKNYYSMDYITILLFNERTGKMRIIASCADNKFLTGIENYCNEAFLTMGRKGSVVLSASGGSVSYDTAEERGVAFSNFTPLKHRGITIGGIMLENKDVGIMADINERMNLYHKVFQSTALVLQNVLYTENLISMTSTDQLTGVYNRRYIDVTLEEELKVHKSLGKSMSVAIFDIDHFKKFNDTYGHPFGDIVLQEVGKYMQECMNCENEWVARYGGEEFVLFFGRSKPEEVVKKVDKIREGLSRLELTDGVTYTSVTASFGVASYPYFDESPSGLIAKADSALYKSKETGRNKVTVAK